MGIYNLNPRRVVWFSPNEPSNKYDIWLSRNAHLDENGEPTTDSNSQRDCDYIFKIYDCGKWNPIVGFNSTAANKIDTVTGADYTIDGVTHSGKEVYHPAIFTAESPNELYDAGTLGSLLSNPNFVSELEWYYLFNSTNYSWDNIFGDTNWFGDLIWETIQGGSSTYHLPFATTERCGGILSDIHTYDAVSAFKPIEVKFYPTTNMYSQKLHRLCVSASDVIQLINNYYNDNPGGSSININWNSTTIHQLAEVLYDIFKNSASLGFDDTWSLASDPHVYPHIWGVSPSNVGKFLRINPTWNDEGTGWSLSNNNMDWVDLGEIIPDLVNDEAIFVPKDGISISYVAPHDDNRQYVQWGLNHIQQATDGQYCRKTTNNGDADIEWVDFPIQGNGFDTGIVNNKIYAYVYLLVCDNNIIIISDSITPYNNTSEWPLNTVPLWENTKYLINNGNLAVTSITIDNQNNMNIYNTSYIYLKTGAKCIFTFPESMNFIQSYTVNSSTGELYTKKDGLCSIQLNDNQYYIIRLEADTIRMEAVDNSIFNEQI